MENETFGDLAFLLASTRSLFLQKELSKDRNRLKFKLDQNAANAIHYSQAVL